ncbi:hypothetical protein JCM10212_002428 [Sporobolomyces blumeae]
MVHRPPARLVSRASSSCASTSDLYAYPLATDSLPVYEDLTLEWEPSCVSITGDTIDLYLNVQQSEGLVAVHEWTDVNYAAGKLDTQLKPSWWNASTGAGSVQAQLGIVPSGQPIWNTPAPSGPLFTVSYNGSYPSVTETAPTAVYTGPSVESVADKNASSTPTGGKLGAAIGVPLIVVAIAVAAYVTWHRYKKRPQKKRFSAVVDKRMSMISQGTWQPRPSMASRPGSFHPSHRPSGSMYSTANRHSYFADPHQRHSTYSALNGSSPLRPPQPAEMRQTGQGDRVSRVSFAGGERPSFTSSRNGHGPGAGKTGSIYTRSSTHQSQMRHEDAGRVPLGSSTSSSSPPHGSPSLSRSLGHGHPQQSSSNLTSSTSSSSIASSRFEDPISRSGTREELRDSPSVGALKPLILSPSSGPSRSPRLPQHAHKPSAASSLRHELSSLPALAVVRDGQLAYSSNNGNPSPPLRTPPTPESTASDPFFVTPPPLPSPPLPLPTSASRPKLSPLSTSTTSPGGFLDMPRLSRQSEILSPDQALASYSVARAVSPGAHEAESHPIVAGGQGGVAHGAGSRMRSLSSVKKGMGKILKSFASSGSLDKRVEQDRLRETDDAGSDPRRGGGERAKSPFDDSEKVSALSSPLLPPIPAVSSYSRDRLGPAVAPPAQHRTTVASRYSQDDDEKEFDEKSRWEGGHAL